VRAAVPSASRAALKLPSESCASARPSASRAAALCCLPEEVQRFLQNSPALVVEARMPSAITTSSATIATAPAIAEGCLRSSASFSSEGPSASRAGASASRMRTPSGTPGAFGFFSFFPFFSFSGGGAEASAAIASSSAASVAA